MSNLIRKAAEVAVQGLQLPPEMWPLQKAIYFAAEAVAKEEGFDLRIEKYHPHTGLWSLRAQYLRVWYAFPAYHAQRSDSNFDELLHWTGAVEREVVNLLQSPKASGRFPHLA